MQARIASVNPSDPHLHIAFSPEDDASDDPAVSFQVGDQKATATVAEVQAIAASLGGCGVFMGETPEVGPDFVIGGGVIVQAGTVKGSAFDRPMRRVVVTVGDRATTVDCAAFLNALGTVGAYDRATQPDMTELLAGLGQELIASIAKPKPAKAA